MVYTKWLQMPRQCQVCQEQTPALEDPMVCQMAFEDDNRLRGAWRLVACRADHLIKVQCMANRPIWTQDMGVLHLGPRGSTQTTLPTQNHLRTQ